MGKAMAKSAVIFGEKKAVELRHYAQRDLESIVSGSIGVEHHSDVNWGGVRAAVAQAEKDPLMREAHVKAGVIDGDLIWRAKAGKFKGEKEYDVVLVRHYTRLVEEEEKFAKDMFSREGSIHDPGGPLPRPAGVNSKVAIYQPVVDDEDEFDDKIEAIKKMPGYFASLSADGAKEKLAELRLGSWLVRASSGGGVTYSKRIRSTKVPVKHTRIEDEASYKEFKAFIKGDGKSKQITS